MSSPPDRTSRLLEQHKKLIRSKSAEPKIRAKAAGRSRQLKDSSLPNKRSTSQVAATQIARGRELRSQLVSENRRKAGTPVFLVEPAWGDYTAHSGGTWMTVTLGPGIANGANNPGKDTEGLNIPSNLKWLKKNLADLDWKSGHLLNADLGGPVEAKNLTALTDAANARHRPIEKWVKGVMAALDGFHEEEDKSPTPSAKSAHWYGFYYSVVVSVEHWVGADEVEGVASFLSLKGHLVRRRKDDDLAEVEKVDPGSSNIPTRLSSRLAAHKAKNCSIPLDVTIQNPYQEGAYRKLTLKTITDNSAGAGSSSSSSSSSSTSSITASLVAKKKQ